MYILASAANTFAATGKLVTGTLTSESRNPTLSTRSDS
jgi:hypothetical protein